MGWKRTPLDIGKLISFVALAALIIGSALWWTLRFASVAVNRSDLVSVDIEPTRKDRHFLPSSAYRGSLGPDPSPSWRTSFRSRSLPRPATKGAAAPAAIS
jgi:hypothetical protein